MQRRASPPWRSREEPAGVLQSQTASAAARGAGATHPATSHSAGGTALSLVSGHIGEIITLVCYCRRRAEGSMTTIDHSYYLDGKIEMN